MSHRSQIWFKTWQILSLKKVNFRRGSRRYVYAIFNLYMVTLYHYKVCNNMVCCSITFLVFDFLDPKKAFGKDILVLRLNLLTILHNSASFKICENLNICKWKGQYHVERKVFSQSENSCSTSELEIWSVLLKFCKRVFDSRSTFLFYKIFSNLTSSDIVKVNWLIINRYRVEIIQFDRE